MLVLKLEYYIRIILCSEFYILYRYERHFEWKICYKYK